MRKFLWFILFIWVFSFSWTSNLWGVQTLSLEDVILIGIKNNPQINIASKVKEQYFYQKNLVKSEFFPYLYLEYSFQRWDQGKNAPTIDYQKWGPYLNWNIFSGFSTWHSYKEALLLISSQDENIRSTILNISLNIVQAYLEYFKQKALYEASLADLEDAKTLLKLAQKRYEVGLSPYADVLDAQAKVKEAEFNVTNHKYTAEIAKANVFTLINYDIAKIDEFEFLPVEEEKLKVKELADCIRIGLTKRPELKAKEKEILAQEEKIKSVKGEFYPSVDIFSSYYKYENLPQPDEEFIAGIRITFPIFLGFSRVAKLQKERAVLEQKNFEKISTELNIKQEIFSNYKNWQTAKENYETALAWLKSVEEDYRIIKKKYENGLASIVDVTTVLAKLSQARAQVAVSKHDLIYAYYRLQKSLGIIPEIEK
ncbi:MAG TPA: TolC family protein [Thermodesulfobacterium geofontis]|nr:TolC family protein [Thermodesulfobacterium geofontis]